MESGYTEARLRELLRRAENGAPVSTDFLNPEEQYRVDRLLASMDRGDVRTVYWGGWEDAERQKLFLLPSWVSEEDCVSIPQEEIGAIRITGSGYRTLEHRSYLGAVLSLGVRREHLGDLVLPDDRGAVLFMNAALVPFFAQTPCPLERVGSDCVRVTAPAVLTEPLPKRTYEAFYDTVASARLDCVVAAFSRLSREKAQNLVQSGDVQLNYAEELRCDAAVGAGDIVSVRRCGKFRIDRIEPKAKGSRLRLFADKYK